MTDTFLADPLDAIRSMHDAAQGICEWAVFLPGDVPELIRLTEDGDARSGYALRTVQVATDEVKNPGPGHRPVCCLCGGRLKPRRFAVGVVLPRGIDQPEGAMTFYLCKRCCPDHSVSRDAGLRAVRQVWPDTRMLNMAPGGTA